MENRVVQVYSPDSRYSRHSEGDFLRLKDGRILFVYSRFQGSYDDGAHCELAACYSADEGEHWTEPKTLITPEQQGAENIMSVSLMRMANGDVGVFYGMKKSVYSLIMLSRSRDEGESLYMHTECSRGCGPFYYVLNNSRVERMRSGRLVVPVSYHRTACDENGRKYWDGRGTAMAFLSDDDGMTWRESADMIYPPFAHTRTGLQEPGVIEKQTGGLYLWTRTDQMVQYESYSLDGGEHWSAPQPSRFSSPDSPLEIARHPDTGDLYAVWNPIPNYVGRRRSSAGWGRTPLVISVSKDDGASWSDPQVLADEEGHGYCYPALFFTADGGILIAHCSGGPKEGICLAQLTIRKVRMEVL